MMDSRGGRVLTPGQRSMVDEDEFACIAEWTKGDFDHLLMATSLPVFLVNGALYRAWNEAVCDGAWGRTAARLGEKIRQGLDLEHWAAFRDSLAAPGGAAAGRRLGAVTARAPRPRAGPDERRRAPLYLSRVHFGSGDGLAPIYQAVCSPFRNPLDSRERRAMRIAMSGFGARLGRLLARAARVDLGAVTWNVDEGPWFDNQVAHLDLSRGSAVFRIEKALGAGDEDPHLEEEVCVGGWRSGWRRVETPGRRRE